MCVQNLGIVGLCCWQVMNFCASCRPAPPVVSQHTHPCCTACLQAIAPYGTPNGGWQKPFFQPIRVDRARQGRPGSRARLAIQNRVSKARGSNMAQKALLSQVSIAKKKEYGFVIPTLLGSPLGRKLDMAVYPLPDQDPQSRLEAIRLHNPYLLKASKADWKQYGYVTPARLGLQSGEKRIWQYSVCWIAVSKGERSRCDYMIPAFLGPPKWRRMDMANNACLLGLQKGGWINVAT